MPNPIMPALDCLVGATCWHVGAGGCSGSAFNLQFGEKVARAVVLPGKVESPLKEYQGEFRIFVQDAHWDLLRGDQRIADDDSDASMGGALMKGLNELVNKKLEGFITDKHRNLVLYFEDNLMLRIHSLRKSLNFDSTVPLFSIVVRGERLNIL